VLPLPPALQCGHFLRAWSTPGVAAAAWVDLAIEMAEGMAVAERVGLAVAAVAGAAERAVLDCHWGVVRSAASAHEGSAQQGLFRREGRLDLLLRRQRRLLP